MPEDRGGLKYSIDVEGNLDSKIDASIAKIQKLAKALDSIGLKKLPTGGSPNVKALKEEEKLLLKIKALRQSITNSAVVGAKAVYSTEKNVEKALTEQLKVKNELLKDTNAQADATRKSASTERKQASDLLAIKKAKEASSLRELKSESLIAKRAGVTVERLRKLDTVYRNNAANAATMARLAKKQSDAEKERLKTAADIRADDAKRLKAEDAFNAKAEKDRQAVVDATRKESQDRAKLAEKARLASDVDYQATQRNAKAQQDLDIKKAQILQVQKAQNISQRKAADIVGVTSSQAKQLGLNMWDAEHAARQFLFTFRRLVGILAVFTLARQFAQALGAAVKEMVNFNKELETAKTGIAVIISSVGQIRDENGELLKGAEAYNVALKVSGDLVNRLRKEAVGSIATFEELTRGFQEAVGPGLAAGLDTNQIVEVSKSLVEGAKTLNIPLNQLGEEIRSLLKGTATARNTRLAVLFGGAQEANEAIRTATEQGRLYEVLKDKLDAVGQGALEASDNFAVLNSDLQDSVSILLAEGGVSLFDELKLAIRGVREALVETKGGETIVSPDALAVVQQVSDGLAGIIRNVREFADAEQVGTLFYQALVQINAALSALAPAALSVFSGILTGVNAVLAPITVFAKIIGNISDFLAGSAFGKGFLAVVKYITAGAVGLLIWKKTLLFIQGAKGLKLSLTLFTSIATTVKLTATWLAAQKISLFSINGLTAIWAALMDNVAVATTVATVGIAALVALLATLVLRSERVKKAMGLTADATEDAAKSADGFKGSIEGAVDLQKEGVKTAKEWADALREAKKQTIVEEAVGGLTGETAKLVKLLAEESAEFDDQTRSIRDSISSTKERLNLLEQEKKLLEGDALFAEVRIQLTQPDTPEEAQARLIDFQNSLAGVEVPFTLSEGIDAAKQAKAVGDNSSKIAIASAQVLGYEKELRRVRADSLKLLEQQIRQFTAQNTLINQQQDVAVAQSNEKAVKASTARLNTSVRTLALATAEAQTLKATVALEQQRRSIALKGLDAQLIKAKELPDNDRVVLALQEQITREREKSAAASIAEVESLKAQTAELERQEKLLAGNVTDALSVGLEDFVNELPSLGEQIAETITGSLTDLSGVVADVFKDAIDPRTDADLKTAFGEFFLDLAGQFVQALVQQSISDLLVGFGVGGGQEAQQAAQTAAVSQNTAALQTLNATISAASTTPGVSATVAGPPAPSGGGGSPAVDTAKSQGIGATIGAAMSVDGRLFAILLPLLIGLISQAFKKGGQVKGYASGGSVGDFARPASIPASDTVPAWLTPGEFVVKKDMVKKYGTGMLTALNNGLLNPGSFAPAAFALGGMAKGIRGYAAGGQVARTVSGASQRSQGGVKALPVMVTSEKNANQIFTGGRRALTDNVNKVPIVGDTNAKGLG